jgi:hypothetical protein
MQCSCGRGPANPYGYRALGQWIEACDECAADHEGSRKTGILHGEKYWFEERKAGTQAACAWCGAENSTIGVLSTGRYGWPVCRSCYTTGSGEEPWLLDERLREVARSRDALLDVYQSAFGRLPTHLPRFAESDPRRPTADIFPVTTLPDQPCMSALYASSESPGWVRTRERSLRRATAIGAAVDAVLSGTPGYRVQHYEEPHPQATRWTWKVDHNGAVHTEATPSDAALEVWTDWVESVGDPLLELAGREAASLIARTAAPGAARPTRRDVWQWRLVAARLASASLQHGSRADALDALCGLGYYGDTRPELIPSPEEMATARWPLHPVVPLSPELQRRPRD